MREVIFTKKNKGKWLNYERLLKDKHNINPKDLTRIYLDLTDDLAYVSTYYPDSQLTIYLNELAGMAHRQIYKVKKESGNAIKRFYLHDFPLMFYKYRRFLFLSFLIFLLFALIGMFSTAQNADFTRWILGNAYVDATLENINKGDPMAVYKQANEIDMFLGITLNNIKVALFTFMMGLLFGLGTLYYLMQNAIMLGAFQFFFYQKGLLWESVRTIWIHGTIEISVIIVAGAAGFILASGILMPGTYTRKDAFIQKARDGLKVMLSTVPFFIIAGFLEGFITRHTEMPDWLAILIIFSSLFCIIYYYVVLPKKIYLKETKNAKHETKF
jgi:uncharacterized membrane protein SpoIIM required for sporulation